MSEGEGATGSQGADAAIGGRLDAARAAQGWTVSELARQADVSRETVHQALDGNASLLTMAKLAVALGLRVEAIMPDLEAEARRRYPGSYERRLREIRALDLTVVQEPVPQPYSAGGHDVTFTAQVGAILAAMVDTALDAGGTAPLPPSARLAVLDGIEQAARISGRRLPEAYWLLRRALVDALADLRAGDAAPIPGTVTGLPEHTPTHRGTPAGGTRAVRGR